MIECRICKLLVATCEEEMAQPEDMCWECYAKIHGGEEYEYMVTHFKSGESDGAFATYEEAKAHYDSHDEEWREAHYIEEVRKGDEEE
jgi:hypothetical protein